jgi:hypothetical protein
MHNRNPDKLSELSRFRRFALFGLLLDSVICSQRTLKERDGQTVKTKKDRLPRQHEHTQQRTIAQLFFVSAIPARKIKCKLG